MKVAAIVPSLNPDEKFTKVIDELVEAGFERIYVVNDGSGPEYLPLFEQAAAYPQVTLMTHEVNRGKGRGLKNAFQRCLEDADGYLGAVTLDADGQHGTEDVVAVAKALEANPDSLVLGVRDFSQIHVPKKNALGNKLTRGIFRLAAGFPVSDTQTGLRGVPGGFMRTLLGVDGERYEFETNMLLATKRAGVPIVEVPISTIYIDNNATSHFRPLRDGLRIYLLIAKFALSSGASALIDLGLFTLLNWLLTDLPAEARLFAAVAGARVLSATCNFYLNRQLVFGSKGAAGGAMLRYAILCVCQMLCSYGGIYLFSEVLSLPAVPAKIVVDLVLFCISFNIQRRWVFRKA